MLGLLILLASTAVAILGFIHSHTAEAGAPGFLGLTTFGAYLILIAAVGFCFGMIKEIRSIRKARRTEAAGREMRQHLKEIHAKVIGEAEFHRESSPKFAALLQELGGRITAVASKAPESDLSMSDFARSMFRGCNFMQSAFDDCDFSGTRFLGARFSDSTFDQADFRGADLGNAVIDDSTVFPREAR